jgi:hypothetical protein
LVSTLRAQRLTRLFWNLWIMYSRISMLFWGTSAFRYSSPSRWPPAVLPMYQWMLLNLMSNRRCCIKVGFFLISPQQVRN